MPLASGQEFAGFTIVKLVGTGGMGEVYLASHPRLPREDALKVLPISVSSDNEFRQRFIREADMAATLWHPHIVGVHDRGEFEGRLWISMDYVDGHDAAKLLHDQYPKGMPAEDVIEVVTAVGDALDYAHQRKLLHRDVKPANILLTSKQGAKRRIMLTDFGIARRADEVNGLTSTNITVGSMSYTAPEQLMGQPLDGRADQYSLAATAYRLFTGTPPFAHSNPAVVISHHLNSPPPKLADTKPELAVFDSVMAKALSKDPKDRYDTCHDFAVALAEAATGTTPEVRTPAPAHEPAPPTTPLIIPKPANPPAAPPSPSNVRPASPSEPPVFTSSWAGNETSSRKPVAAGTPVGMQGLGGPAGPGGPPPTNFGPPPLPHNPIPKKSSNRRNLLVAAGVIGAAVLLIGGITMAVTSGGDNGNGGGGETTSAVATDTSDAETTTTPKPAGHAFTIADYIKQSGIVETQVHRGDPGAPAFTMPTPPGWIDAGPRTPAWAYSAIVNDPVNPTEPPSVVSLISKLAGDVDPNKLLEFAPNELQNLTDYKPSGDVSRGEISGFPTVHLAGTYAKGNQRRAITQTTVVIQAPGNLYVLQINADATERDKQALTDINKAIEAQATIAMP
ncbi:LpqN/LpqT family lipoprotein [Mycolicibacterium porcinum]|uniref:non-specific serine/threonine protein kinase n=1 Tax=Mycolicibacterium porcinum TaxID=39693 RepID=A0AAW5SV17_9MYCO|nr:LpqN/LpqT family lipoprotein [Mycolicibacterium porcinum]MCV7387005.1 LpqN/LpqT family lipoprotein [Mycolicibacterium porcinum]ORB42452.1 serine/threonine protein kinase [Mycolicibacterium porcinum]CDO32135.1 serine/threonine protein kinase [Mycolicibacterium vulneris]